MSNICRSPAGIAACADSANSISPRASNPRLHTPRRVARETFMCDVSSRTGVCKRHTRRDRSYPGFRSGDEFMPNQAPMLAPRANCPARGYPAGHGNCQARVLAPMPSVPLRNCPHKILRRLVYRHVNESRLIRVRSPIQLRKLPVANAFVTDSAISGNTSSQRAGICLITAMRSVLRFSATHRSRRDGRAPRLPPFRCSRQ